MDVVLVFVRTSSIDLLEKEIINVEKGNSFLGLSDEMRRKFGRTDGSVPVKECGQNSLSQTNEYG